MAVFAVGTTLYPRRYRDMEWLLSKALLLME